MDCVSAKRIILTDVRHISPNLVQLQFLSYSVQLKSEDRTIRGNSKSCKPHYRAGPRVILTWQEIITFTDKETCMHTCSYSDTVISEKTKNLKSLFSRNKQRSKDILKHFTTASEIKSYQGHLQKHKPQEMITQYACNKPAS